MPTTQTGRVAVLTLESFTSRLSELSDRAFDVENRYSGETDADVAAKIGLLQEVAESCVWGSPGDYEDEKGIERLRRVSETASRAWTYLRSECPKIQRALKTPGPEDAAFLRERAFSQRRANSAYCRIWEREEGGDALRQLRVPGMNATTLDSIVFNCSELVQVRRVLRAVGLESEYSEKNGARVLHSNGHAIERIK